MTNNCGSSSDYPIPNLMPITAANRWKFQLYCIWENQNDNCVDVNSWRASLYNFSHGLTDALKNINFIHEFSHLLYGLALVEMTNNPDCNAVKIPFDYPANGNFLSEAISNQIEWLLSNPELMTKEEFLKDVIYEYAVTSQLDWARTKNAIEHINASQHKFPLMTVFEASRQSNFESSAYYEPGENLDDYTIWGEKIYPKISPAALIALAGHVYDCILPAVINIRSTIKGTNLTRVDQIRLYLCNVLKNVDFSELRELIKNPSKSSNSLIPSP